MKAIVQNGYGSAADVLEFKDIDEPVASDDEVVVRVEAASIHVGDVFVMRGVPYVMRPVFGLTMAKNGVPGTDIAGTVESTGKDVSGLAAGDRVFGWCKGAFAEYATAPERALTATPANLTIEQAAATGVSAFTALQVLRDIGKLTSGQHVLVNGASGGVGTFAVQIAKTFGADVTGVCSTRNVEMVRSLGADHVIDYTREDFTSGDHRYDIILDNVGNHSLSRTRSALTPNGTLLANGSPVHGWFGGLGRVTAAGLSSIFVARQGRPFVSTPNPRDLATLRDLAEAGSIVPVIDRTYPLSQGADAMAHVAEGHAQGTTVLTM
jgi:NADPH:quinone reductase-like Zn-dependent oxidoreductase